MDKRPRIDLDGLTLSAAKGPSATVAVVRYRTVEGLVLSMPESADIVVPWEMLKRAELDLVSGELSVEFVEAYAENANWLGGLRELKGRWTDRLRLRQADVAN